MGIILRIAALSFLQSPSQLVISDSSYEHVMFWVDTLSGYGSERTKRLERRRYREGPFGFPIDDFEPTYYLSPWTRPGGKV